MDFEKLAIKALKGNDREEINAAFNFLYEKYCKLVYVSIKGLVPDSRDAEELTDDTFIKIFNNRKRLCETKNIKYYIMMTAKNVAYDFKRKRKIHIIYDDDIVYTSPNKSKNKEIEEISSEFAKHISLEDIDIIMRHILHEETFKEIGEALDKPTSTIKTRYFRAIDKLHSEIGDEDIYE